MKIEKTFEEAQSYKSLCDIAEKAEPNLSFWGTSYITVEGYEGALHSDAITKRLFELMARNYEFNEIERNYGKIISTRIDHIYDKLDAIFKTSNLFTKILYILRNFSLHTTPRYEWKIYLEKYNFDYYTRSQFKNVFGYYPEVAEKRGFELGECSGNCYGAPTRWSVISAPQFRWFFGFV